jgi:hypothetical protein
MSLSREISYEQIWEALILAQALGAERAKFTTVNEHRGDNELSKIGASMRAASRLHKTIFMESLILAQD